MKKNKIEQLIEEDNGYLITSKAVEAGISKPSISKYVKDHDMEKVAHGIYILEDVWPDELFILQERNKNIIYSGETALYLHGLTDREYQHICFTVPTGYNAAHIKKTNKEVHYAKDDTLQMGICEVTSSSGNLVRAYDKERCICDMIRERKKYDFQVFQTAMKEYMTSKDKNVSLLVEYAVKLDIRDKVMMYVEVLV